MHVENLIVEATVFRGGTFEKGLSQEGSAFLKGLMLIVKGLKAASSITCSLSLSLLVMPSAML
jgi:hypothetical protein